MSEEKTLNAADIEELAGDVAAEATEVAGAAEDSATEALDAAKQEADNVVDGVFAEAGDAAEVAASALEEAPEQSAAEMFPSAESAAKKLSYGSPKKAKNLARGNAIAGFLFVLPFIIGFLLFLVYPLGMSVRMAFSKVSATSNGLTYTWVGAFNVNANFYKIFRVETDFLEALVEELKRMALFVPGILVFSFFMATLLNQEFKGRTAVRAIYFLPVILASGVFLGVEANNPLITNMKDLVKANNSAADITKTLEDILLTGETGNKFFQYVIDIVGQVYDIAMASGIQIIVFLSGLQTIPPSMYEAAKMEGCTAWESFWKITFPLIGSMILVNVVYTLVDFFTRTDSKLMTLINDTLLIRFEYGKVAAMSWTYFLIVAAFLGLVFAIFSRRVYYYD